MTLNTWKKKLFVTTLFASVAGGVWAGSAMAQAAGEDQPGTDTPQVISEVGEDDEARQEKVTVTGSRIARSEFSAESPVSIISAEEIRSSGNLQLSEILREQPAVGSGGFNQSSNLSGGGAQSIDLRNLGADRVLTLVNGRRVAKFADALQNESADLGFIPTAMVERVEILKDGASAAYGADAVTGVVNVILRDDYEGLELTAQVGRSDFGDRDQISLEALAGVNSDRGNIVMSLQYANSALVDQQQRDFADYAVSGLFNAPSANEPFIVTGSGAAPGGRFTFVDPVTGAATGNNFCTLPKAFGGDEVTNVFNQVDANGNVLCPNQALANFRAFPNAINAGYRYDYAFEQSILGGDDRFNASVIGNYAITDAVNFFAEVQYANRTSNSNLDGNPIFGGSGSVSFPGGWVIDAANPYNPFPGEDAQVTIRPTSTIGIRAQETNAENFRIATGIEGEFLDSWNWELSFIHTETSATTTTDSTFNLARAIRISDPAQCAADPICTAALQPGSLGALDAYRPGNWSESEIAYFRQVATSTYRQEQNAFNAFVAGEAFQLPAGPLGVAVGFEYREEELDFRPDATTESGESVANQTFSTSGGFDTYEVFAEANVPLLADMTGVKDLSVNLQGRAFDYSTFGSDSVYKIGLNYTPFDDLRFRATYGTSYRVPTLVDTFSGGTVGFQFITDPCDAAAINLNATREANCLSGGPLGVPAGFTQSAPQIAVLGGGDLADGTIDLGPEEGTTYTIGAVYNPSFLSGLNLSVDYYSIEVENFISTTDVEGEILEPCFDSAGFSAPECALFSRDTASRQLAGLTQTPINRADPLETAGIDWAIAYGFDLADLMGQQGDWGYIGLGHQGNYVLDYNLFPDIGNYDGSGGTAAVPEYRLNFQADWAYGPYSIGYRGRYTPELDTPGFDGQNFLNYNGVDDLYIQDVILEYETEDELRLLVGVNNIANEEPPYAFSTGTNTIPGLYGSAIIGRYYYGRVTKKF